MWASYCLDIRERLFRIPYPRPQLPLIQFDIDGAQSPSSSRPGGSRVCKIFSNSRSRES